MYMTCIRGVIASIVWNPHTHWPTYTVELLACPAPSRRRRRRLARPLANHVFEKLSIFSTDNVRSLVHWLCFFCIFLLSDLFIVSFFRFLFVAMFFPSLTHSLCSSLAHSCCFCLSLCVARKFTACASCVSFLFSLFFVPIPFSTWFHTTENDNE